jgi:DNA repair protein RadC
MEKAQRTTNYPNLASENFAHGKKRYFIDVKKAANDSHFLLITSSEQFGEGEYHRQTVQLWEEDLGMFVEGLSMVLRRLAHGDLASTGPVMKVVKEAEGMQALALEDRPREKLHVFGLIR